MFIHIPKCGGSSLERRLAGSGWRETFSVRGIPADRLKAFKASPQHFHAALLEQIFNFEEFTRIVAIVRDPLNRLKSEYYWQFRNVKDYPDPEAWIKTTLSDAKDNPYLFDNHIRPQVEFLPQGVNLKVFKLERDGVQQAQIEICGEDEEQPKNLMQRLRGRKPENEKTSVYNSVVETAFAKQRAVITDFYATDYAQLGYDPAGM